MFFPYDDEGNETAKLSNANTTWWTYGYDHRNQLIAAKKWNANPEVPGTPLVIKEVDYTYDWYGNRVQTDLDSDGNGSVDSTEKYALDYWNSSGHANVWADLDSGNSLTTRYLRGDGADELLGRANSSGTPSWLLTDRLGSVRNVTDSTGAMTATATYDAWSNATTTGTVGRYLWTGRERDVETGLQYNRARWYDAGTGRWLSQDPLGFDAGDSNLYRYVKNRSTGGTDPGGKVLYSRHPGDMATYLDWLQGEPYPKTGELGPNLKSVKLIRRWDGKDARPIYQITADRNEIEAVLADAKYKTQWGVFYDFHAECLRAIIDEKTERYFRLFAPKSGIVLGGEPANLESPKKTGNDQPGTIVTRCALLNASFVFFGGAAYSLVFAEDNCNPPNKAIFSSVSGRIGLQGDASVNYQLTFNGSVKDLIGTSTTYDLSVSLKAGFGASGHIGQNNNGEIMGGGAGGYGVGAGASGGAGGTILHWKNWD